MKKMEKRVALITGAGSGIGRATALAFAREGAKVVAADVQPQAAEETVELIKAAQGEGIMVQVDISQAEKVDRLIHQTVEKYGSLDYAFNNAGIEGKSAPTAECDEGNWDRVIAVNLKGVWLCMKYEIQQMLKQGGGSIVNCASVAGIVGFPGRPPIAPPKAGSSS